VNVVGQSIDAASMIPPTIARLWEGSRTDRVVRCGREVGGAGTVFGGAERQIRDWRSGEDGQNGASRHLQIRVSISGCRLIILGSWVRVPPALPRLDIQPGG